MDELSDIVITKDVEKALRRQKHDFINHVQVVQAYLQMGKAEKALAYLNGLVEQINAGTFCSVYACDTNEKKE